MRFLKISIQILSFILPWSIRRHILVHLFGFKLHKSSKIGFSIILAHKMVLKEGAIIRNGTFINAIDELVLEPFAKIGNYNWITGSSVKSPAYRATPLRECVFRIGEHTRITDRHYFDCNGGITIGKYSTVAGLRSQFITHGINILENKQEAHSIKIGNYCMIGSRVLILKNSMVPDNSVLAAGAVLNKIFKEPFVVLAGMPARRVKVLPEEAKYFSRLEGPVK